MKTSNVIAIDGPSGSGKSTISKIIARELDFLYIDTGAMYRAITCKIMKNHIELSDTDVLTRLLSNTKFDFFDSKLYMDGSPVGDEIRHPEIDKNVSVVSANSLVRAFLSKEQRKIGLEKPSVIDGRDIGTVLFRDAVLKIFLTADVAKRAERRYQENIQKGITDYSLQEIIEQIRKRDEIDSTREIAPLRKAEDAVLIDSSNLSIEEIVEQIKELFQERIRV